MSKSLPAAKIGYLDVALLRPLEGHGPKRVGWLLDKIVSEGIWTVPLRVERSKFLVMDGHHRFEVAKLMNLRRVPVELSDYDCVEVFSLRRNIAVSPEIILKNADEGTIFPYKTAKHKFSTSLEDFEGISIDELK